MATVLDVALALTGKYGVSVLPIGGHDWVLDTEDGPVSLRKKPAYMNGQGPRKYGWLHLQKKIMEEGDVRRYFSKAPCIAVVMGAVSGFAECIDFDEPGMYQKWRDLLDDNGHEDLTGRLVIQETQTPGHYQAMYRCPEGIEGNQKLAMRPPTDEEISSNPRQKAYGLIETRGEGGYALIDPSEGYRVVQGSIHALPTLTGEERTMLLRAAQYFDRMPEDLPSERPQPAPREAHSSRLDTDDDFDRRGDWAAILEPHGWTETGHRGPLTEWTRPGKSRKDGGSATSGLGRHGIDMIRIFTTSGWPLDNKLYGKFRAYQFLNCGGDRARALRELYAEGYGDRYKPEAKDAGERPAQSAAAPVEAPADETQSPKAKRFKRVRWSELKARPQKEMLVEGLIGKGDSIAMVGKRKGGKSALTFDMILKMLAGREFANRFEIPRPLRVGYFTEEGTGSVHTRLDAANRDFKLPDAIIEENLWYFEELPQLFNEEDEQHIDHLVTELLEENADLDLIILDTFVKSIDGAKENDSSDVSRCLKVLGRARKRLGCASVLIHHTGKNGDVRGSSAIDGDVDGMYFVDWNEDKEGDNAGARALRYGVAKDLMPFDDVPFTLTTVDANVPGSFCLEWAPAARRPTARKRIVTAMRRDPGLWWTKAQIKADTGLNADTLDKAIEREIERNTEAMIERHKPEGTGQIVYRLTEIGKTGVIGL